MTEHIPGVDFSRDPQILRDIREQTRYIVSEALEGTRQTGRRSSVELVQAQSTVVEDMNVFSVKLSRSGGNSEVGNELLMAYVPPRDPAASIREMVAAIYDEEDPMPYSVEGPLYYVHLQQDGTEVSTRLTDELSLWLPRVSPFEHGRQAPLPGAENLVYELEEMLRGETPSTPQLDEGLLNKSAYILDLLSVLSNDIDFQLVPQND